MIKKSVAVLNSSAPLAKANAKEALDIALIFGTYEQNTSLFFQGEGVWQLVRNQSPELANSKDFLKTFAAFEFYDLDTIYVCQDSLKERNLAEQFHIDNVTVLTADDFSQKLHQHDVIFRF